VPYSQSIPLKAWRTTRRADINTLAAAHTAIGEVDGPGRPRSIGRPVGHAYVLRVVAEFQGFVRDLHDLAAQRLVEFAEPKTPFIPLLSEAATRGRTIDRGNATLRGMAQDFGRLGIVGLVGRIKAIDSQWSSPGGSDGAEYENLIDLRNALGHGNQGQVDRLRANGVMDTVSWTRQRLPALNRTARALDRVVWDHLASISGQEPW
jgi:hypothetical protein